MSSKRKYGRGDRITSLAELDTQEFIYCNGKVYHAGFWKSWQYRSVQTLLNQGRLYKVIRLEGNDERE